MNIQDSPDIFVLMWHPSIQVGERVATMKKEVEAAEEGREETEERAEVFYSKPIVNSLLYLTFILGSCQSGEGLGGEAEVGGAYYFILTFNLNL